MSTTFFGVSIDCADAAALAGFWAEVLGRRLADDATAEHAVLLADELSGGPRIAFHRVPEEKLTKNRLHFDLLSETFDAETKRLLGLGARTLRDIEAGDAHWTTFADIEGNEFDLIDG
ncbi:MAG TPA: VOC family protein [Acidimicrobiales bacterium]|nr:VOC family protein [Acidimicrobiales bacterium]